MSKKDSVETLQCVREGLLTRHILILEGFTRAGKFFLGRLSDGLENVEHFQYASLLEQMPPLLRYGFVEEKTGIALMRLTLDEFAYNQRIGRGLNFRFNDGSSFYKVPQVDEYLKRCFGPERWDIVKEFRKKRYSAFIVHELIANSRYLFAAFPQARMVSVQRHPVDVIYSWWIRKMGTRETDDPVYFNPYYRLGKTYLPWYAIDWHKEYARMSPVDRVIKSLAHLLQMHKAGYRSLTPKQKKQVLFISYEKLVEDSWSQIRLMEQFLGVKASGHMPVILTRERCPRPLPPQDREKKLHQLKKSASPKAFKTVEALASWYEHASKDVATIYAK